MCLTTDALALFLTLLGGDIVTIQPARITVHATEGDVVWHAVVDDWCTSAGSQQFHMRATPDHRIFPLP